MSSCGGPTLTSLAPFSTALAHLFTTLGADGWLTKYGTSEHQPAKIILTVPGRADLVAEAPMSLINRFLDLAVTSGAATGDLVTLDGATYVLARSPDPDELGLAQRWIGVPLALKVGSIAYHADGHPLVEFNGVEWVVEGQI